MLVVRIILAAIAFIFVVVCHIAPGQVQRSAVEEDSAAAVMAVVDPVARHRAAGDAQRSAVNVDAATCVAAIGCNDTVGNRHRSVVVDVNTAADLVVSAAADNIAALHGQRSALHADNMFAAVVLERAALDVQCTSVDTNRLVRAFTAPDYAGEGDGMLFQRFRRAGAIGRGCCDVICQGILIQGRLIAVNSAAGIVHGILSAFRVLNGKRRVALHFEALAGFADCQGMPVQIDGSVLRNAQIRAIIPIRRPGIVGQLKFAALGELIPDIAGQRLEG